MKYFLKLFTYFLIFILFLDHLLSINLQVFINFYLPKILLYASKQKKPLVRIENSVAILD